MATGGTLDFTADRTALQCAPDSVRCWVDTSALTFDAVGPTGSNIYDARLHDVEYFWDFGDAANTTADLWSQPVNVLDEWKRRYVGRGPFVSHMYLEAGTYTIKCAAYERSSGKWTSASKSVVVATQDSAYPTTKTICVNPVGDSDFSAAPTGAVELNLDTLTTATTEWSTYADGSNPVRWLFKRGGTYTVNLAISSGQGDGIMFGAYGSGARPILNGIGTGSLGATTQGATFYVNSNYGGFEGALSPDIRFDGLNMQGNHDPVTQSQSGTDHANLDWHAVKFHKYVDAMISDCRMAGFAESTVSDYANLNTRQMNIHLDDCLITDFGGQFCIIMQDEFHVSSSFSMTGTALTQNPDAMDDDQIRSPLRLNHILSTCLDGCDVFHTDRAQPALKLAETPEADGMLVNVHRTTVEGGSNPLSFVHNVNAGLGRSSAHNMIADSFIAIGNHGTTALTGTFGTGLTLRNVLMIMPPVEKHGTIGNFRGYLATQDESTTYDATIVGAAPIRMYNCTLRMDRTGTQNGSASVSENYEQTSGGFSSITTDNNVIHEPATGYANTTFAPVTTGTLFEARNKGSRNTSGVLDGTLATPAGSVIGSELDTGSSGLNAATSGLVAATDIRGKWRAASADKGAWEV